jgi:hypothetical protein
MVLVELKLRDGHDLGPSTIPQRMDALDFYTFGRHRRHASRRLVRVAVIAAAKLFANAAIAVSRHFLFRSAEPDGTIEH